MKHVQDASRANPTHTEVRSKNSNLSGNRSSSDWHKTHAPSLTLYSKSE